MASKRKKTNLDLVKSSLHATYSNKELTCRKIEFDNIYNFVRGLIKQKIGGCMYISGVPGTGKTATVNCVMNIIKKEFSNEIKYLEINGFSLSKPDKFYSSFYEKLFNVKIAKQRAIEELDDFFNQDKKNDQSIILLLDELDLLCTTKQDILYHLFDWPHRTNSRLVILAIANKMDLPETMTMNKIQSRIGLTRLTFSPYTFKEFEEILKSRINGLIDFNESSLSLICRKVAAISGDARRVLDLASRAIYIAEEENPNKKNISVTLKHVTQAVDEVFSTSKVIGIQTAPEQEKILLTAILQEFKMEEVQETKIDKIYSHHVDYCRINKKFVPSVEQFINLAENLFHKGLIFIEKNKCMTEKRISLNLPISEIEFALTDFK